MRELGFIQSKHLFGALVCIFEPLKPLLLPKYYAPNLMQARSVLGVQASAFQYNHSFGFQKPMKVKVVK